MATCPRCQATVNADAIQCARCGLVLKAHGHPGIPLYRAEADGYLCDRCVYHIDNSCNFPQRPLAKTCTLFQDAIAPAPEPPPGRTPRQQIQFWLRQSLAGWVLVALLGLSFLIVWLRS